MLLFWSCRLAAGACLSSVCDLRQPHGHKHTRTQWDDLGNYEKRVREEKKKRKELFGGGEVAAGQRVGWLSEQACCQGLCRPQETAL